MEIAAPGEGQSNDRRRFTCITPHCVYGLMVSIVLAGCHSEPQDVVLVDYGELPVIGIELELEIGESADFIPGNLVDLILASDGTMVVSDRQKTSIEQFSPDGEYLGKIAREGEGPGELPFLFELIDGPANKLLAWNGTERRMRVFERKTDGLFGYSRSVNGHSNYDIRLDLFGSGSGDDNDHFYAFTGHSDMAYIQSDLQSWPDYRETPVAVLDSSLEVLQDSLHMLKIPQMILEDPARYPAPAVWGGRSILGMPPYRYYDRFILHDDGRYVIARPDSSALFFYGRDHQPDKRIDLNVKQRPVERSDLDVAFENHRMAGESILIRRALEERVEDFKPPFLNVWVSDSHILLHTDNTEGGKEMVLLTMEGEPEGRFYMSDDHDIRYLRDEQIYALYKNPLGHSIRIYSIE